MSEPQVLECYQVDATMVSLPVSAQVALAQLLARYASHPTSTVRASDGRATVWVFGGDILPSLNLSRSYVAHDNLVAHAQLYDRVRGIELLENWGQHGFGEPQLDYLRKKLGCPTFELPRRESLATNLGIVLAVLPALWPKLVWPSAE